MWVIIIYAIFALFVMVYLISYLSDGKENYKTGTAVILWGYVNFKMLTGGKDTRKPKKPQIEAADNETTYTEPKKIKKPPKTKYCKECGSEIDGQTKKCTGCGKQYFHLPKITALRIVLIVLVVCLVGLNVYQYIERTQTVTELNETLARTIKNRETIVEQRDEYSKKYAFAQTELAFWNDNAVICTTEGNKWHHYGCGHIAGRNFYIFNTEYAKYLGYTPCLDCCGE
jgi:uncharacterized protein YlaI